MNTLFALALATVPHLAVPVPQVELGAPAPDFVLPDLEGNEHRLADLRGRVVVLEWTSHVCPAVAAQVESRILLDTRAALDPARVTWLQVDSSWFAPALADGVRAWRQRLGLAVPYLLDSKGEAARAFRATSTPQVCVLDREGRLAYSGAVHDGAPEAERRNHVVEAVQALLAGGAVPVRKTRALGCTIKLGEPREATRSEVADDAPAQSEYREAVRSAERGEKDAALAALERAFGAGLPNPQRVLADGAFRELFSDAGARRRLRERLAEHPARGHLTLVAPDEPGEPFVLAGAVRDEAGAPIHGAVVSLYHTDAAGYYSPGSTSGENPRLFGSVTTDKRGRYRIRTVVPGYYADSSDGLVHVHMSTRAEGFRAAVGHRASVYFDDDPNLVGANRREIVGDGCAIRTRSKNAEGVVLCTHDVILSRR